MLTSILKAIEMLLTALGNKRTPAAKINKLGKSLVNVHLQLIKVIENGNKIVSTIETSGRDSVHFSLFEEQCLALHSLINTLENKELRSILLVQLPEFKHINLYLHLKMFRVYVYLSAFYGDFDIARHLQGLEDDTKRDLMTLSIQALDELRGPPELRFPVSVHFKYLDREEELADAKDTLENLTVLTETLRVFLKENFKLEELI